MLDPRHVRSVESFQGKQFTFLGDSGLCDRFVDFADFTDFAHDGAFSWGD